LRHELEDAREIVGRASLAFPVSERLEVEMDSTEGLRHGVQVGPMPTLLEARIGEPITTAIEEMRWRATRLDVLLANVHLEDFNQRVHFRVRFADEQVGYAISQKDLYLYSKAQLRDRVLREIAPVMAEHLTNLLKGK